MNFVDKVNLSVIAGDGGNGKLSFRHERAIAKGGPDGGNGGNGGDIVFLASRNHNTLAAFRYQKELRADSGQAGGKAKKHGRSAKNLIVAVPVGTAVTDEKGTIVADLVEDSQQATIAKGGRGGYGNAHFVSSRRQAPTFAEKGEPGEEHKLQLELKMIADVGLVGLPNAGKSTLLSKLSNARPEIADYPFTTLVPNLGVVDIDNDTSVLMADIPGLIEGAALGKGLGHDFLRHIERTAVILHLIDSYNHDAASAYLSVRAELEAYKPELIKRPEIIALTKIEGLDKIVVEGLIENLRGIANSETPVFAISAQSGTGLSQLKFAIKEKVIAYRTQPDQMEVEPHVPVLTLSDTSNEWQVGKDGDTYVVTGHKVEQFAKRTDFSNDQAVQRLRDIMRRAGIMHELRRQGIEAGQSIRIGTNQNSIFNY